MKAGSYISLARNYSFVIIVLVFISFQGTQNYIGDLTQISAARALFVDLIVNRFDQKPPQSGSVTGTFRSDGIEVRYHLSATRLVRIFVDGPRSWASSLQHVREAPPNPEPEVENDADNAGIPSAAESRQQFEQETLGKLRDLHMKIFGKMAEVPSGLSPLAEAALICPRIESNAIERRISVPGLGLEFRNGIAPWFIALTVLGLLTQIRNQVRRASLDPNLALDEPWLILDGRRGSEKFAAGVWSVVIFLSPWVAAGSLVAISAAESIADGWAAGALHETAFHLCLASLLIFGGWTSLTAVGELLRLRRLRLEKLLTILPA